MEESIDKYCEQQNVYNKQEMVRRLNEVLPHVSSSKLRAVEGKDIKFECNAVMIQ